MLNKEQILTADDRPVKEISVPEWGGTVHIRALDGRSRDEYESFIVQNPGRDQRLNLKNARAKLVAMSAVDEKGERMFSDDEMNALASKSGKVLDRIFQAAMKLSGLAEADIKELTESLKPARSDDSISSSPSL